MKKNKEIRSQSTEVRAAGDGRTISGYALVFDQETDMGYYRERIDRSALASANMDDVRALFNHNSDYILARTASNTLKLEVDQAGLRYEFEAPNTTTGNDVLEMVRRGDLSGSSFAFFVRGDKWDEMDRETPLRTITDISEMLDVGPVTYPAYSQTSVSARSVESMQNEQHKDVNYQFRRQRELDIINFE